MGRLEVATVSGMLHFVGKKLAQLLTSEYSSIVGATKDLQELHALVEKVNYWLGNAEDKFTGSWLRQLKDIAYAADSFVDDFQLKAHKHEASGVMSKFMCTIPKSFTVQSKVRAIKNRFSAFVKEADYSAITNSLPASHPVHRINKRIWETSSLPIVDETYLFRRDCEKEVLLSKLVETDDQDNIIIVSIVGLGGLGKTTMAQHIYNDARMKFHFEVRLWVAMSQVFNVDKLVMELFGVIANETSEHQPLQYMRNTISDMLIRKRCLIVLDNVWTEERHLREEVMELVQNCAPGSRILLTTRSIKVAEAMESRYIFELEFLSESESWELFLRSLGMAAESLSSEFVQVGKKIVNKCCGIPIAIKALAGVLHGREQIEEWNAVRDNNIFVDARGIENRIFTSLILSYYHMPSHLKQCFAICSLFPKGHRIDKEKLIDLWIAHDMITPESGVEYLEDIGHECFDFLLKMSFLQDVQEEYGRVTCLMHDLIHELARTIMGEEISLIEPEVATSSTKSYRYFSITEWPLNLPPENLFEEARAMYVAKGNHFKFGRALQNAKHLRSITVEYTESIPTTIFPVINLRYLEISGLKCEVLPSAISDIWSLQALHVTSSDILNLPKSIGNLQKLRTLNLSWCKRLKSLPGSVSNCHMISNMDLSGCIEFEVLPDFIGTYRRLRVLKMNHSKIKRLPSSVTSLGNLECLDLQHCSKLVELPEGLDNLKKLKVLNLEGCPKLSVMLEDIRQLGKHQNVNIFIVGENKKCAKISELRNINGITYLMNPGDEQRACLEEKTGLQRLRLQWGRNDTHKETNQLEAVFDGLKPPSGIKELYVGGYAGEQYAQWMLKQVDGIVKGMPWFPDLTVITLCGLPNLKNLNGLMELPCLEELDLRWMPCLESISGGPFPLLSKLRMEGLHSLKEVWMVTDGNLAYGEEGQMQIGIRLSKLHIEECPKLKVKPYFPSSLEHLVLHRSNQQLLLSSGQVQGPSSSSSLPPSCRYSHLKELELWGMTSSSSPTHGPGSKLGWNLLQHMSTLESLKICQCGSLTELPNSMRSLTSLQSLLINFCSAICMLPEWLGELRSLQKMAIQSCHSLSGLQAIGNLASLQELRIERCDGILELPECLGELCSLRKFDIVNLHGVTFLPMSMCRLTSLEELEISDCQGLTSLPEWIRDLRALQKLKITGSLSGLQSIGNLVSLQELRIERCDGLLELPECLGELCSLRRFAIASLHGVTFLSMSRCRLTSLEELEISDCQGLTSLPQWIRDLPAMQKLKITGCPELERRCEKEKGEDWHLISHIPHRQIGFGEEGPAC